jgi:hypothetical protein
MLAQPRFGLFTRPVIGEFVRRHGCEGQDRRGKQRKYPEDVCGASVQDGEQQDPCHNAGEGEPSGGPGAGTGSS